MALWPFIKKAQKVSKYAALGDGEALLADNGAERKTGKSTEIPAEGSADDAARVGRGQGDDHLAPPAASSVPAHDASQSAQSAATTQYTGPFDGDTVNIEDFDFSDFARSYLNLGSLRIPMPEGTQVQVEMAETAPRKLHIVSRHGRITPVAFAAATSTNLWDDTRPELAESMKTEGFDVEEVSGPWGMELVGRGKGGEVRVIGVDAPRWMLRFMLMGPADRANDLLRLGRDLVARTFVYRGTAPILAGNSLPVRLPTELVEKLQQAMQQRAQQQKQRQGKQRGNSGNPS